MLLIIIITRRRRRIVKYMIYNNNYVSHGNLKNVVFRATAAIYQFWLIVVVGITIHTYSSTTDPVIYMIIGLK